MEVNAEMADIVRVAVESILVRLGKEIRRSEQVKEDPRGKFEGF